MLNFYARGGNTALSPTDAALKFGDVYPSQSFTGIITRDVKDDGATVYSKLSVNLTPIAGSNAALWATLSARHKRGATVLSSYAFTGPALTPWETAAFQVGDVLELDFDMSVPANGQIGQSLPFGLLIQPIPV